MADLSALRELVALMKAEGLASVRYGDIAVVFGEAPKPAFVPVEANIDPDATERDELEALLPGHDVSMFMRKARQP